MISNDPSMYDNCFCIQTTRWFASNRNCIVRSVHHISPGPFCFSSGFLTDWFCRFQLYYPSCLQSIAWKERIVDGTYNTGKNSRTNIVHCANLQYQPNSIFWNLISIHWTTKVGESKIGKKVSRTNNIVPTCLRYTQYIALHRSWQLDTKHNRWDVEEFL